MLFQLVCTDRRYARMNCFNIRELQSVLKRRFFADLMSSHDYRTFFGRTIISLRFRLNSTDVFEHDSMTFHNFGLKNNDVNKLAYTESTTSNENISFNRNTLVNFIDYELLANKAHIVIKNKFDNLIVWQCIAIFKNNLMFLFDTFLNSNFFSF